MTTYISFFQVCKIIAIQFNICLGELEVSKRVVVKCRGEVKTVEYEKLDIKLKKMAPESEFWLKHKVLWKKDTQRK